MKPPRYKVEAAGDNEATLTVLADCWLGDAGTERCFWANRPGYYVYEISDARPGTSGMQVGPMLCHSGNMLLLLLGETMAQLVRREAAACLRAEKRDAARY